MALDTASTKTTRVKSAEPMSAACPNGHTAGRDDYCDVCGAPIGRRRRHPAAAVRGCRADAARRPRPTGARRRRARPARTARTANAPDALFCESCGYDFTTGAMPRGAEPPRRLEARPSTPPPAPAQPCRPGGRRDGWPRSGSTRTGTPCRRAATRSRRPGLPRWSRCATLAARGPGLRSRDIHPEIDCGTDTGVSRRQAQLTTDGTRWWVEDLGSSNGTFVGPRRGRAPRGPDPGRRQAGAGRDDRIYVGAWTRLVIRPATDEERDTLAR